MRYVSLEIGDDLVENQILWRYMDLAKFVSMVDSKSLWLARVDTLRDKHEGRFPDEMKKTIEKAYDDFDDDEQSSVKNADDFQDYLRKNTFVSCWHKNLVENMVMWEIYGRDYNAIAIQTTAGKMKNNLDDSNLIGHSLLFKSVVYQKAEEIRGVLPYEECVFIKRPHFSFEKEVRISLDTYFPKISSKDTPYGHALPMDVNKLVYKILVHPDSSDWFMGVIKSITKKYKIDAPVERGVCGVE